MNVNLRELYLADNKLNGLQDSAHLGNLLKFNCSLQILDLRNNHVLDSGAHQPRRLEGGGGLEQLIPVIWA
jgi:Leucine-rich repeat (LRR) protein